MAIGRDIDERGSGAGRCSSTSSTGSSPTAPRRWCSAADGSRLPGAAPGLPAEDRALARQTPVIAGEAARAADHPVARHHEGDRVAPDRRPRPRATPWGCRSPRRCRNRWWRGRRGWRAGCATPGSRSRYRSTPPRSGLSGRHRSSSKMRCACAAVKASSRRCRAAGQRARRSSSAASSSPGSAKASPASPWSVATITATPKGEAWNPCRITSPAPRALKAPGVIASWVTEEIVQPARTGEADLERGVEHRGGILEQALGGVERDRGEELLRRDPGEPGEETRELHRRQADGGGDRIRRGLSGARLGDEGDRLADAQIVGDAIVVVEGGEGEVGHRRLGFGTRRA